jgi:NADH dehydrogenase FAD-containing subunit
MRHLAPSSASRSAEPALRTPCSVVTGSMGAKELPVLGDALRRCGVEVRTQTLMEDVTDRGVRITGGKEVETATIVWSAGVRPDDAVSVEVARSPSKRIVVDKQFRIDNCPGAFAIGDLASVRYEGSELPMLSPPAMQAGHHGARLILGKSQPPFRYIDNGTLATIGRSSGVGQVGPSGSPASPAGLPGSWCTSTL